MRPSAYQLSSSNVARFTDVVFKALLAFKASATEVLSAGFTVWGLPGTVDGVAADSHQF